MVRRIVLESSLVESTCMTGSASFGENANRFSGFFFADEGFRLYNNNREGLTTSWRSRQYFIRSHVLQARSVELGDREFGMARPDHAVQRKKINSVRKLALSCSEGTQNAFARVFSYRDHLRGGH